MLAAELRERGHVVRGTTRDPARRAAIEAAGAEAHIGDPDRMATITPALAHVTIAYVLLGSATGPPEQIRALHESRLDMLLLKLLDTTVRAIVYESVGSVDPAVLAAGAERVRTVCEGSRIPFRLLDAEPADHAAWVMAAADAGDAVLG
jgi:uncharacterized protein YbjT (DUF2867 family)